jgi:hypothetical protein
MFAITSKEISAQAPEQILPYEKFRNLADI